MPNPEINFGTNVLPKTDETYDLGSTNKKWNNIYGDLIGTATKVSQSLIIGGYTYDGSTQVSIPIYDGSYDNPQTNNE